MNRVVVDRTGLDGRYDIVLKWSPEQQQTPKDDLPSLFTALQEQLGLNQVFDERDLGGIQVQLQLLVGR